MAAAGAVQQLIDFGDASIFAAMAYPSIILIRKVRETRNNGQLPDLTECSLTGGWRVGPETSFERSGGKPRSAGVAARLSRRSLD